jgi:hypothetical protein
MEHLDAPLFQTLQTLPAFPFALLVRPDRASVLAAREAFFLNKTIPSFTYSRADRFDCKTYFFALDTAADRIDHTNAIDDIKTLYQEKLVELHRRCSMIAAIQNKDDSRVSILADELYGTPMQSAEILHKEFESMVMRADEFHTHREMIDATSFTRMAKATLEHYDIHHWTVRQTNRSSISIVHASTKRPPVIKIPKQFSASRARATRVLTHEIETHALRTHNGLQSPLLLLGRGCAGYLATEEGLAIAMQQRLRKDATVDPGFWDAWTAALTQNHDAIDVFTIIHDAKRTLHAKKNKILTRCVSIHHETSAQDAAWRLLLRCMRGIHTPTQKGLGYRRDHIYRSGLLQVRSILEHHGDAILPTFFAGNIGIAHIPLMQSLGITGRTPDFVAGTLVKKERISHPSFPLHAP